MNLWKMPQIVGSFLFLKISEIIDQNTSLFVLVVKEVFAMDLKKLKTAANKINMPQDMKERIIKTVQQSCDQCPKPKEAHPSATK